MVEYAIDTDKTCFLHKKGRREGLAEIDLLEEGEVG